MNSQIIQINNEKECNSSAHETPFKTFDNIHPMIPHQTVSSHDLPQQGIQEETESKTNGNRKQRVRCETWDNHEIRKIFKLYNDYGSQWKLISAEFDDRYFLSYS